MVLRRGADASATSTSSRSRALRLLEGRAGDRSRLVGARGDRERRPRARPVEGDAALADLPARRCCARGSEGGRRAERPGQIDGHRLRPTGRRRAQCPRRARRRLPRRRRHDRSRSDRRPSPIPSRRPRARRRRRAGCGRRARRSCRRSRASGRRPRTGSGIAAGRSRSRNLSMWKICSVDSGRRASAVATARRPPRFWSVAAKRSPTEEVNELSSATNRSRRLPRAGTAGTRPMRAATSAA